MSDELVLTPPGEDSIGPRLARLRNQQGMTVATVAARLHCDESIITALETERFDDIGARVFVQGHLRRYGEFLGVPVDELLAEWSRRSAAALDPDLRRIPRAPMRAIDPQLWGRRVGALAAAVVIAVAAWWILRGGSVAQPNVAPQVAQPNVAPQVAQANVAPQVAQPNVAQQAPAEQPVAQAAASSMPQQVPMSVAIPAEVIRPTVAASRAVAVTAGSADCWIEIYDARGQRLFFDLLRRGNKASVEGEAPLRVLLGRADVATLEIDGKAVVIPAQLRRDSTAHILAYSPTRLERFVKPGDGTESAPR